MEDVKTLARILKEGYAGWEVLDFDWNRTFLALAEDIESAAPLSAKDFVELLVARFSGVEDRHFGFFLGHGGQSEWHPVASDRTIHFTDLLVSKAADGRFVVVDAPKRLKHLVNTKLTQVEGESPLGYLYRTLPDASGETQYLVGRISQGVDEFLKVDCSPGSRESLHARIPLHACGARLNRARPRPFRLTRIPFPRIELGSFSTLHSVDLEGFVQSAEDLRGEPLIVVDLRGNPGGSDRFGKDWLEFLTQKTYRSWKIRELVSPVTLQGDVLLHEWLLAHNGSRLAKEQAGGRLEYFRARLEQGSKEGLERRWSDLEEAPAMHRPAVLEDPYHGKLILLVDRGTRSSAETFVLMARQVPGTIVVGENTGGMVRFGEVKLYQLPNSGVWVQAGSKHFEDPTGAFREGWGFAPDYWIDDSSLISSIPRLVERVSIGSGAIVGTHVGSGSGSGTGSR